MIMRAAAFVFALMLSAPSVAAADADAKVAAVKRHEVRTLVTEDVFGIPNLGYEYFFGDAGELGLWARVLVPLAQLQIIFPDVAKSTGVIGDVRFHHLFARVGPGAFAYTVGGVLGAIQLTDPASGAADTSLWMSPVGTAGYHLLLIDDALDISLHIGGMYVVADYPNVTATGVVIPPPGPGAAFIGELGAGWRF